LFIGFRRGEEIQQSPPTHPCNLLQAVWSRHFIWDQSATIHTLCHGTANLHNRIYNLSSSLRQSATVIKEITVIAFWELYFHQHRYERSHQILQLELLYYAPWLSTVLSLTVEHFYFGIEQSCQLDELRRGGGAWGREHQRFS
jgi:hypothetical protein